MAQPSATLLQLAALARKAGAEIMRIYATGFVTSEKPDHSPVTAADTAAEAIILHGLADIFPGLPVVAEEQVAAGHGARPAPQFLLVDPLDGTREFISRNGEFTVNIALIREACPVMGVVYAPVPDELFIGAAGEGAFASKNGAALRPVMARPCPAQGPIAIASRSHRDAQTTAFLAAVPGATVTSIGSSLKFCRIAEGMADLYPRFGRTMEWDTAAGHAVLSAAGGRLTAPDGSPFLYGKPGFENPPFIARGR